MTDHVEAVKSLIAEAQIEGVRLVDFSASTRVRSAAEVREIELRLSRSATASARDETGTVFVVASVRAELVPTNGQAKREPVVAMKATFEIRYRVPTETAASDVALAAFAEVNGVYNVWPYWRELIQSTFVRMNLPPITLPLFRVGSLKAAVERLTAKSTAKSRTARNKSRSRS